MSRRLMAMGQEKYKNNFKLTIHPDTLTIPDTWNSPKIVFVNSMSDLFHKSVPLEYIKDVFEVMNRNPQHVFQVLTKQADRLFEVHKKSKWTHNIWMGVSVENDNVSSRIDYLRRTRAKVKFLSLEPLIGPFPNLKLNKISWVIVGGESGRSPRPMDKRWVIDIQKKCRASKVPFFFKQWGETNKKALGRTLNGRTYDEMPKVKELGKNAR